MWIFQLIGGEATLLFSTKTEIRAIYLDSRIYFTAAKNLSHTENIAINGDYFYCSNVIEDSIHTIVKGVIDGKHEAIVTEGERLINGIINNYSLCKEFAEIHF